MFPSRTEIKSFIQFLFDGNVKDTVKLMDALTFWTHNDVVLGFCCNLFPLLCHKTEIDIKEFTKSLSDEFNL